MINFFENNNYDYIINHSFEGIIPEGSGVEIFNFKTLEYLWKNEKDPKFREHATGMLNSIKIHDEFIKKGVFIYKPDNVSIEEFKFKKISIDTENDYNNSVKISNYFNNYNFSYNDILINYNNIII